MEKSNAISNYIYEDEFSYVTEEGAVYRKKNTYQPEKEVGHAATDNIEEALDLYRRKFAHIEEQIETLDDGIDEQVAAEWRTRLRQSEAIGDFEQLYKQLDERVAAENEDGEREKEQADQTEVESENGDKDVEKKIKKKKNDPVAYYKDLTKKAQQLSSEDDWQKGTRKLDELSHQWSAGPGVEGDDAEDEIKDLYYKFTKAEERFQKQKEDYYARAEKQRKENLAAKQAVLNDIEKVVNAEKWSATGKIKSLERKWNGIGSVPKEQAGALKEKFKSLVKEFKSHKVDRLVEKRQKQEDNLMMKMVVLDKMENVASGMDQPAGDWGKVEETFLDLTRQWKKIGRVPREKSNQVWNRYKSAQDLYYDNKYKYDKDHRSNVDSFTAKKENIIEAAEALIKEKDIAKAARKVNKLHRRWKKIGNLPQRKEDKLWDRFKAATDAFNEKKANNQDKIHDQEEHHYEQKLELIDKAEQAKDTDDWGQGHKTMQALMDQWKKIGPVPRKKSGKIWKQFKGAMDVFYDRRREHFKEAKEQQKENLKTKQNILDKLEALGQHEDPIEAVNKAKKLQAEFKDVGYVPIKRKNEMWKKYRAVCDVIYDRMRAAKSGSKFDQELAKADLKPKQRSKIQDLRKEHKKMKKEVRGLKQDLLQMEESKTNFNFSDDDNPLLKEFNEKISKARAKLESKKNKLEALSIEMEDIREEA